MACRDFFPRRPPFSTTPMFRPRTPRTTTLSRARIGTSYQSWGKPFGELCLLLGIIADQQIPRHFSFQHSPDLSEITRIFLSVGIHSVAYEIVNDDIRFNGSDLSSGRALVTELKEYASRILSTVRVSNLVHSCIKPHI